MFLKIHKTIRLITGWGFLGLGLLLLTSCAFNKPEKEGVTIPEMNQNREQYLDWFREAKFGMFIHWGPYSCFNGEWNGRQVPVGRGAEWIMKILEIPVEEYRELAHRMNPVRFNAREYVQLAKAAGMKYVVITAKHHDGFAMYHSRVSPYNIYDWTPFKRDPLKELAEACAEEGVKFCIYYSHREDWDHPGGYGNHWDYDNDWGADLYNREMFEKYLDEKAKPQLRELLTNYGPVGLVWFDRGMYTREQGLEFVNLVNDLQPATLINGRVGHYDQELLGDYQSMSDNGMPPGGLGEYWETPQTLNTTWGYSRFDTLWKTPESVIIRLAEIVSRGGNYLLNIGPGGDGEIPDTTIAIFKEVGRWMERNSECIYGTSPNPFGELPWGYCTTKGNKLYFLVRDWPAGNVLTLPEMREKVKSATMLTGERESLKIVVKGNITEVMLPAQAPDKPVSVVVIETEEGVPQPEPRIVNADKAGNIMMDYLTVKTYGKAVIRFNRKGGFHISKWTGPEDAAELFGYRELTAGYVNLSAPGRYKLTIRPGNADNTTLMYLKLITLHPVEEIKKDGWGVN